MMNILIEAFLMRQLLIQNKVSPGRLIRRQVSITEIIAV
jgi:hypothetical protein